MSKTYTGEERKAAMLEVGAKLAAKHGSVNVTRKMLADAMKPPVAEGLVSHYFGSVDGMRKAVKARAKKLGLVEPDKAKQESIGVKLRAHGPRDARDTRKRSAREVEAIKRKTIAKRAAKAIVSQPTPRAKTTRTTAIVKGAKVTTVRKAPAKVAAKKSVAKVARTATASTTTGKSVKRVTTKATDQREVKPAPGVDNKATSLPALPPVGPASTPTAPGPDSNKATAARQPKAPPANLAATI